MLADGVFTTQVPPSVKMPPEHGMTSAYYRTYLSACGGCRKIPPKAESWVSRIIDGVEHRGVYFWKEGTECHHARQQVPPMLQSLLGKLNHAFSLKDRDMSNSLRFIIDDQGWHNVLPHAAGNQTAGFFDISLGYSREVQMLKPDTPAKREDVRPEHMLAGKRTAHCSLLHVTPEETGFTDAPSTTAIVSVARHSGAAMRTTTAMIALHHFTELAACHLLLVLLIGVFVIGIFARHALKRKHNTCNTNRYTLFMGLSCTMDASNKMSLQVCNQAASDCTNSSAGAKATKVRDMPETARQTKPVPNPPAAARERPMSTAAAGQPLANRSQNPWLLSTQAQFGRATKPGTASIPAGNTAFPRGRSLLLSLLAMAQVASATVFATRAEVAAALVEFCTNEAAAEATHETIGSWNVSAVTDMNRLISNAPCRGTFNADILNWDTSSVTNMNWMFHVRTARAPATA